MRKALLFISAALLLSSCTFVRIGSNALDGMVVGSGNTVTETFSVAPFESITIRFAGDVEYTPGVEDCSVAVTASDNVIKLLDIFVDDGTLVLALKDGASVTNSRIKVNACSPSLSEVKLQGSGDFTTTAPMVTDSFSLTINGSGDIDIDGLECKDFALAINGSGDAIVSNIDCESIAAAIRGSGDIRLSGKADAADISIYGSGDIDIREPETSNLSTTKRGSGDILK